MIAAAIAPAVDEQGCGANGEGGRLTPPLHTTVQAVPHSAVPVWPHIATRLRFTCRPAGGPKRAGSRSGALLRQFVSFPIKQVDMSRGIQISPGVGIENSPPGSR